MSRLPAQVGQGRDRRRQFQFIDVTPSPSFSWLEGCDHGVARVMEMLRGVAAWRTIATADMTTAQAETKVNPRRAQLQTLFATGSASWNGLDVGHVLTA